MEWLTFEPSTLCLDTVALNWVSGTPEVLASLVFLPKAAWRTVALQKSLQLSLRSSDQKYHIFFCFG